MGKKRKLIARLEAEIDNLKGELARVEKQARKQLKKAERDAAALRGEVLKLIGQNKSERSDAEKNRTENSPAQAVTPPAVKSTVADSATKAPKSVYGEHARADQSRTAPPAAPSVTAPVEPPAKKAAAAKKTATKTPADKTPADKTTTAKKTPAKKTPAKKAAATPTVAELRQQAKAKGVKGYSTMTKAKLLDALS